MTVGAVGEFHHSRPAVQHVGPKLGTLGSVLIYDYSGEELEQIARESFVPVSFRTQPDFSWRIALHEIGNCVTLSRADSGGPHRMLRTERLAAKTSGDDVLSSLFMWPVQAEFTSATASPSCRSVPEC